jgi:hypothetical protein
MMDDTFYSDSRSFINKSNVNISIFNNKDNLFSVSKRMSNLQKMSEAPQYVWQTNALSKADSVYSSNNIPIIKDCKAKRFRPMSMKQPRKLRQKIDEKYLDKSNPQWMDHMPTAWNNSKIKVQIPFSNEYIPKEDSFMRTGQVKSPGNNKLRADNEKGYIK